jgi:rare lipoprotein A (peptidoglycan hydrolase)
VRTASTHPGLIALLGLALLFVAPVTPAGAAGWASVHRYVHKTGNCGGSREVLASTYGSGHRTANGERFNPQGLTAASHDYALGSVVSVRNPHNGRVCSVRINDRGPHGTARRMGAKLDFATGAARCLGMRGTQYVCAP